MSRVARLEDALQVCAEYLAAARDRLGSCGEGDGQGRRADADALPGSRESLRDARAALSPSACTACDGDREIEYGEPPEKIDCPFCSTQTGETR